MSSVELFEDAGFAEVAVEIQPALGPRSSLDANVRLVEGTAVLTNDYTGVNVPTRISFTASVGRVIVRIPIVNDRLRESTERFELTVTPSGTASTTGPATGVITILDDDKDNARPIGSMLPVSPPCGVGQPAAPNGVEVAFDLSKSRDPDGKITDWTIRWDDGSPETEGTGQPGRVTHTFVNKTGAPVQLVVELRLKDNEDKWSLPLHVEVLLAADGHLIRAGDSAESPKRPVIRIRESATGDPSTWMLDLSASADPDGRITSWSVLWDDGSAEERGLGVPGPLTHTFVPQSFPRPWLFAVQVQMTDAACRNSLPAFAAIVVNTTQTAASPGTARVQTASSPTRNLTAAVFTAPLVLHPFARRRRRQLHPRRVS